MPKATSTTDAADVIDGLASCDLCSRSDEHEHTPDEWGCPLELCDPCLRSTPGCSVDHSGDGARAKCEAW